MPVDDLTSIDIVTVDATTGEVILVIADHLEWDEKNEHLLILQNKLNVYLDGIENGSLYEGYPDAANRSIVIRVMAKYEPNENGRIFLERAADTIKTAGYRMEFSVLET